MNQIKYIALCWMLALSAVFGCSAAPDEAADTLYEVETYTYGGGWGSDDSAFLTADELRAQHPDLAERALAPKVARQAITDCVTDNEDLTYAVSNVIFEASWMATAFNWTISNLTTVANTTGVLPRLLYPQIGTPDVTYVVGPTSKCGSPSKTGPLGLTTSLINSGKRSQSTVYVCRENMALAYPNTAARIDATKKTFMHETGHAMGLRHFTGAGTNVNNTNPRTYDFYCMDLVGVGFQCPWGSYPGGQDTAMSYCGEAKQFDGCELEELYWNIGPGAELSGGSGTCSYSGI